MRWRWLVACCALSASCDPDVKSLCEADVRCPPPAELSAAVRRRTGDALTVEGRVRYADDRAIQIVLVNETEARPTAFNYRAFSATLTASVTSTTTRSLSVLAVDVCGCQETTDIANEP